MNELKNITVIGAGTMGAGIAHFAAMNGHYVVLIDMFPKALEKAKENYIKYLSKLVEKSIITQEKSEEVSNNLKISESLNDAKNSDLVIEAIIEDPTIKQKLFNDLEEIVSDNCILATNTSSLSIASLAGKSKVPSRLLGMHFFNPPTIMQLVEIIPSVLTDEKIAEVSTDLMNKWGKTPVRAKDTPGFIVNRVARPYYAESIKILDEGIANIETIDYAMKEFGGFKMGPFELMDMIGHDVNYVVTETVFKNNYFDPRFRPSVTQLRMLEAGLLGKKTGRGFYDYINPKELQIDKDHDLCEGIFQRVISMVINEAFETMSLNIATKEDIEFAMLKATNYPKGPFEWAELLGYDVVFETVNQMFELYGDMRYRPNIMLKFLGTYSENELDEIDE
jgi:3-hydroxybutyryl-CoA dehydrogenase